MIPGHPAAVEPDVGDLEVRTPPDLAVGPVEPRHFAG